MQKPRVEVVSSTTFKEVERMRALAQPPILQIGSKEAIVDQSSRRWRELFPDKEFIGLDIEAGANVDRVADICMDFAELDAVLDGRRFGFIVCQHVLEHVRKPWLAARNIQGLLMPGGYCYIAVPWVQAFHGFPSDFWRFSFPAVLELFDELEFVDMYYSASGTDSTLPTRSSWMARRSRRTPFEIEGIFSSLNSARSRT
jgi:SAM-dependent methyltransferase